MPDGFAASKGLRCAEGGRRAALRSFEAPLRVVENRIDLRARHSGEPFQKIIDCGSPLEILEQGFDRNAAALEKPGAAHLP
jgi:hypothetical protein